MQTKLKSLLSEVVSEQGSNQSGDLLKRIAQIKSDLIRLGLDVETSYPNKKNQVTQFLNSAVRAMLGLETELKKK